MTNIFKRVKELQAEIEVLKVQLEMLKTNRDICAEERLAYDDALLDAIRADMINTGGGEFIMKRYYYHLHNRMNKLRGH